MKSYGWMLQNFWPGKLRDKKQLTKFTILSGCGFRCRNVFVVVYLQYMKLRHVLGVKSLGLAVVLSRLQAAVRTRNWWTHRYKFVANDANWLYVVWSKDQLSSSWADGMSWLHVIFHRLPRRRVGDTVHQFTPLTPVSRSFSSFVGSHYCHLAWMCVGMCVYVCVSATLRSNISETKGDSWSVTITLTLSLLTHLRLDSRIAE